MDMLKNKLQIFVTIVFLGFVGWWISFQHVVTKQGSSVNWFENTYGFIALIGAIIGFFALRKWGGFKSVLGKSLAFFTIGLFAQEVGQLSASWYTQIDKVALPYPGLDDIAYFGGVLLYIIAALYLAKVAGVKFSLKRLRYKVIAIGLPIILLVVSFLILMHNHQYNTKNPVSVFLDAGYPIGEALYISIAIVAYLLSRKLMGGIMKAGVLFVIVALCIQYASDFTFIYQGNRGTFVPGKFDDLLYLIAYYVLTLAMIKFLVTYNTLRNKTKAVVNESTELAAERK
jgi:hypothetical protein